VTTDDELPRGALLFGGAAARNTATVMFAFYPPLKTDTRKEGGIPGPLSLARRSANQTTDVLFKVFRQTGLREEEIGTGFKGTLLDCTMRIARKEDHGNPASAQGLLEAPRSLDPVEAGHGEVHDNDVGLHSVGNLQRRRAVGRSYGLEAAVVEILSVYLASVGGVVYDQDETGTATTGARAAPRAIDRHDRACWASVRSSVRVVVARVRLNHEPRLRGCGITRLRR
jgi:hypothetical protein